MRKGFVQVRGQDFFVDDEKIIFRGFGIGSWMNIEHFMFGIPGTESQMRKTFQDVYGRENASEFFNSFLECFIQKEDFIFLKGLGINALRLSFNYRHFIDDLNPEAIMEEGFHHLDRVLGLCEKFKIYAILDMHTAPGGQNPDWHADSSTGMALFWEDRTYMERIIHLWEVIATRYKDNQWVAAYDVINEPYQVPDYKVFNEFFDTAISRIRKIDPHHVIFVEGDDWATNFNMFKTHLDPNVAYSFHFYPCLVLRSDFPKPWSKDELKKLLAPLINLKQELDRPLWCGETGGFLSLEGISYQTDMIGTMLDVLEENEVSWSLWSYKDSGALSLLRTGDHTPWTQFTRIFRERCSLQKDWENSEKFFDMLQQEYDMTLSTKLRTKLGFRLRGIIQEMYIENLLKPELSKISWSQMMQYPKSFLFGECVSYEEIVSMVKSYTIKTD